MKYAITFLTLTLIGCGGSSETINPFTPVNEPQTPAQPITEPVQDDAVQTEPVPQNEPQSAPAAPVAQPEPAPPAPISEPEPEPAPEPVEPEVIMIEQVETSPPEEVPEVTEPVVISQIREDSEFPDEVWNFWSGTWNCAPGNNEQVYAVMELKPDGSATRSDSAEGVWEPVDRGIMVEWENEPALNYIGVFTNQIEDQGEPNNLRWCFK